LNSTGALEINLVSHDVKDTYYKNEDVKITLRYKMTKGVIDNIMLMPLACRFRTPPAQCIARPPRPPDTESYQGSLHP